MSDLLGLDNALADRAREHSLGQPPRGAMPESELPLTWPEAGPRPHRFAGIFRMLQGEERHEFDESIRIKGLLNKIVMFEDAILDGRNRYIALVDAGIVDPALDWRGYPDLFTAFDGTAQEALERVWMLNEQRRHDSAGERAMAAARYKKFLEQVADPAKLRKSDAELAAEHGVSERLLNSANAVLKNAEPDLVQAVDEGRVSVTDAAEAARLAKEQQAEIAAAADRKAAKRKVQAAKAPDLPPPLSRTDLALFSEAVCNLAHEAAKKHGGAGASISADKVLKFARDLGLIQQSGEFGFTRPMLLALNKLRDTMPDKPAKAPKREPDLLGPTVPPLGGEWSQQIGGLSGRDTASIAVFHEEDETFSVSVHYSFATTGGGGPFAGSYPDFHAAIAAAAGELLHTLRDIHDREDSVTSDVTRRSAKAGADWLQHKLDEWGIALPDPVSDAVDEVLDIVAGAVGLQLDYDALVAEQGERKGHHTKASAEPILRAGRGADIEWQRIADDIGHPLGTVQGWSFKLGLTGKGTGRSAPRGRKSEQQAAA